MSYFPPTQLSERREVAALIQPEAESCAEGGWTARDEQSRRTQRKQQTTRAEDEHKDGGYEFAKPSLLERRRRQRLLEPGSGRDSHLKPAIEGSSGWCAGWERGLMVFVLEVLAPRQARPRLKSD